MDFIERFFIPLIGFILLMFLIAIMAWFGDRKRLKEKHKIHLDYIPDLIERVENLEKRLDKLGK